MITLVGCGQQEDTSSPMNQSYEAPLGSEDTSMAYHIVSINGVSFEVDENAALQEDETTHNRFGDWYSISTSDMDAIETDWYMSVDVSNDEFNMTGTYDEITEIDGVKIYTVIREVEGFPPFTSISFNYNGRGYEIYSPLGTELSEASLRHVLDTLSFE